MTGPVFALGRFLACPDRRRSWAAVGASRGRGAWAELVPDRCRPDQWPPGLGPLCRWWCGLGPSVVPGPAPGAVAGGRPGAGALGRAWRLDLSRSPGAAADAPLRFPGRFFGAAAQIMRDTPLLNFFGAYLYSP